MNFRQHLVLLLTASVASAQQTRDIRLWGWADLHAHPAAHLAFGADANGDGGILWGKPGLKYDKAEKDIDLHMPPCSFKHGGSDGDLIRHETHKALMENLDSVTDYPHQTADFGENNFGSPSFKHWPHARSITHQQMHISQIRRAYDGGQRLMIASVTDNEFLSRMWTDIGYNAGGNPVPSVSPWFGVLSAIRQINFIKDLAKANSDWMQVVLTSDEAEAAIKKDKLAIVLSVEMDSLQVIDLPVLVAQGVRHVIPIHLVDNLFGGTAVYNDAFNAVNNFLHSSRNGGNLNNDGFFKIIWDPKIDFRLGRPSYPRPEGFNLIKGGAINIDPVPDDVWKELGYTGGTGGHRNYRGLTDAGKSMMKYLAQNHVMIDVAHMSMRSMRDTIDLAKDWGYPVMDSHTGFRAEDGTGNSERDLYRPYARTIADLGGVIGFGTEWGGGFTPLLYKKNLQMHLGKTALIPGGMSDDMLERSWDLPVVQDDPEIVHLLFKIKTGGDSLDKDLRANFTINGKSYSYLLNKFHEGWRPELVTTPTIQLPAGTKSSKLRKVTIKIADGGWWSLDTLEIQAVTKGSDPVSTWLAEFQTGLAIMNGKGMALGTDINGFAPQMWLPADEVVYPINAARQFGRASAPLLPQDKLGDRMFSFRKDGIAHYGMLADFLQAVNQQPDSDKAMDALFHSANDVVEMWAKCEKVAKTIK